MSGPSEYQSGPDHLPAAEPASGQVDPQQNAADGMALPALRHLTAVSRDMHAMLGACLADAEEPPEVKVIHQLRTGTRRVEAMLETLAREAGTRGLGAPTEGVRQRWLRQLKKVRQSAGAVRDFDVHRELLGEHYLPHGKPAKDSVGQQLDIASTTAHEEPPLAAEAYALDRWLAAGRATAADELRAALHQRKKRLIEAEQQFVATFAQRRTAARKQRRPASQMALEDYLRLMDAMPLLDAENLHEFRKAAKKARYVAEASEDDDPAAAAIGKAIKRVQDAIGDWHDWLVLEEEAGEALGSDGAALEAELKSRVEHNYHRALRIAATIGRRLVGEWQAAPPRRRRMR